MDDLDIRLEKAETQASSKVSRRDSTASSTSSSGHDSPVEATTTGIAPTPSLAPTTATTSITRHKTQEDHDRNHEHNETHTHTVGAHAASKSVSRAESRPLPSFGAGKPYPPDIPAERQDYVVDFESADDPLHPLNWPTRRKVTYAAIGALASFCSTFASSVLSAATTEIAEHFHVSVEVATLASTLYLCGYGVGPAVWGPLSELKGRKLPLLLGNFGFSVFAAGTAVAKDLQTLMICRFFMGVFGSCPLVVTAAMYADIFRAETRGIALVVFASSIFVGPMVGPVIGSFTVTGYLGWRWDAYWSLIMGSTTLILLLFVFKETYPPAVLVGKAEYLRRRTKNWAIHAKQEEIEIDFQELVSKNLSRPLRMVFTEPILMAFGFYLSFVYGKHSSSASFRLLLQRSALGVMFSFENSCTFAEWTCGSWRNLFTSTPDCRNKLTRIAGLMYIALSAYPLVFQGVHHWRPGVGSLPFLGMMLGMLTSGVVAVSLNPAWVRKYHAAGNRSQPEWRLPLAFAGSIAFTIGLFWFGWTGAFENVHWIVPTIGGYVLGFGILSIFMMLILYMVDAYLML